MRFKLLFFFLIFLPNLGFAQEFHIGLKSGVPLTPSFEGYSVSTPIRRYTLGASTEVRFGAHFGIEVDVLYKRIGYSRAFYCGLRCQPQVISTNPEIIVQHIAELVDAAANSWEFPIMAKYSLSRPLRPFLAGGFSARHVGLASGGYLSEDLKFGAGVPGGPIRTTTDISSSELPNKTFPGVVVSSGFEIGRKHFRILPELRYTHWFQNDTWGLANFTSSQTEILVGFLF